MYKKNIPQAPVPSKISIGVIKTINTFVNKNSMFNPNRALTCNN